MIKLYSESENYKLYQGSMLEMLDVIQPNSIDSVITDPPYELNFMNKGWDNSGIAFQKETWEKCYQVLKSGGYLLAFGGSRTFHRIACAIEDAGFEIRDTIMWLYGSGFPKSMNIGLAIDKKNGVDSKVVGYQGSMMDFRDTGKKQKEISGIDKLSFGQIENSKRKENPIYEARNEWAGWGTCLKPSFEPIIVARKPVENTIVDNVIKYGTGGLNIDECRIETNDELRRTIGGWNNAYVGGKNVKPINTFKLYPNGISGRFPANTILTYDDTDYKEVCGGMPHTASHYSDANEEKSNCEYNGIYNYGGKAPYIHKSGIHYEDVGSASRFFKNCQFSKDDYEDCFRYYYGSKANKNDRDEGLDDFEEKTAGQRTNRKDGSAGINAYAGAEGSAKNFHPTVKPVDLMQYLIRLTTRKGGVILDCFNGSGTTGKAVMYENTERNKEYKYIGIELDKDYLEISKARIDYAKTKSMQTKLF